MTKESNYLHTQTRLSQQIHSQTSGANHAINGAKRLDALLDLLGTPSTNILFTDHLPMIQYLCGFRGSNGTLLVRFNEVPELYLCTDGRYLEQAKIDAERHGVALAIGFEPILGSNGLLSSGSRTSAIAVDLHSLTLTSYLALTEAGHQLVDVSAALMTMRARKDPSEIAAITEACRIADLAMDATLEHLDDQPSELELAGWFEYYVRVHGGEGVSFPTIVASGARTSLPHALPTRQRIVAPTPVVVDFGAKFEGYCSDSTRSFFLGDPPEDYRLAYEQVAGAKAAAVARLEPGDRVHSVESAARTSLREHGVEQYLLHGVGHSVGLEIHEPPITSTGTDTDIEANMCLTVEPGLYFAGSFGIRLEDLYLTTASKPIALTDSSATGMCFGRIG